MLTATASARERASRTKAKCPWCSAPMVGTRAIRRLARRCAADQSAASRGSVQGSKQAGTRGPNYVKVEYRGICLYFCGLYHQNPNPMSLKNAKVLTISQYIHPFTDGAGMAKA